MSDQQYTIQIDRKTRAHRSGNKWAISKAMPDGHYDTIDIWEGNRRSLFRWCEDNKIHPSREAIAQLNRLPERNGFKEDEPL